MARMRSMKPASSLASSADIPARTLSTRNLTLPVLLDDDGGVAARLNPRVAMPLAIYVDREGRRAHEHEGYAPGDEVALEQRIVALLGEAPPKP